MIGRTTFRRPTPYDKLASQIGDHYLKSELHTIERLGTTTTISAGEVFVTEGRVGREVILILSGTAAVARDGEELATVGAGDFVGERAVLLNEPRNASLIATTDLEIRVYTLVEFGSLLAGSASLADKLWGLVRARS